MFDTIAFEELPFGAAQPKRVASTGERKLEGRSASDESPTGPWPVQSRQPGVVLAVMLSSVELDALEGADRVVVMQALQRMVSHYQARLYEAMDAVADAVVESLGDGADPALAEGAAASEIRAGLRLTRRAADAELAVARGLRRRLPEVWDALESGRIDRRRAHLLLHHTGHLSLAVAREIAHRALEQASDLTTGQLTVMVKKLCVEADPADARIRFETALEERRLVVEATQEGTAHLHLYDIAPDAAMAISRRVNAAARHLKTRDEARTMDQLRADVTTDLLMSAAGVPPEGGGRGGVIITTTLTTLAGLEEKAGDLRGYGPVIADIARQVAQRARSGTWEYVVTTPTGRPIHAGAIRRRPTAPQRRNIEAAYPTCVFPGCRIPAQQCDIDHTIPWSEGGPTNEQNSTPKCRYDHILRHQGGWRFTATPEGGHQWTSPLGHTYPVQARGP